MRAIGLNVHGWVQHCLSVLAAALSIVIVVASLTSNHARAQQSDIETGALEVRVEKGFARLVFSFTNRPRHTVSANAGVLVLRFERPVDVPLTALSQRLPNVIPSHRIDADRMTIRMALNRKFRINSSEAGDQLFLDLLPEPWSGALPPLPAEVLAEMARKAEEIERQKREEAERQRRKNNVGPVTIAESEAPSFSRLEFLWPQKPTAIVKRNDGETEISFDRIGVFELGKVRARLPRFIDDIRVSEVDARSVVTLMIDPLRDVRSFIEGNAFVIDVLGPEKDQSVGLRPNGTLGPPEPRATGGAVTQLQGAVGGESEQPVVKAEPEAKPSLVEAAPNLAPAPPLETAALPNTAPPIVDATPATQTQASLPAPSAPAADPPKQRQALIPLPLPRPPEAPPRKNLDTLPNITANRTEPLQPGEASQKAPASKEAKREDADLTQPAVLPPASRLTLPPEEIIQPRSAGAHVNADYQGPLAKIDFAFPKATSAAVFLRGATLWLVFDAPVPDDLEAALVKVRRTVRAVQSEAREGRSVVRLLIDDANLVSAQLQGPVWQILIGDAPPHSASGLDVKPRYTADGRAALHVEAKNASPVLRLVDPVVGDVLTILTLPGPEAGIAKSQGFVDADFLRSVHGVVIKENADDVTIRLEKEAIIVERAAGLALSSLSSTRAIALSTTAAPELRPGFVDFEGWKLGPVDHFLKIRQQLIARATKSEGPERTSARLDLARLYLAHQLGPETLSLLSYAGLDDALIERDPSFRILRGVAGLLARRFDIADRDLNEPEFDDSPDVSLWRGLVAAERSDWGKTRRYIRTAQPVIDQYPRQLQRRALLALAEAQLELGDIGGIELLLDEIFNLDRSPASRAHLSLLRGRYSEMLGRVEVALNGYLEAVRYGVPRVETEASLRHTELASKIGRMPREQAVENLNRVSFAWRGDAIELKARQLQARFAIERGDYRDAFTIMRGASSAAPKSPITQAIQDEAKDAFAALFLDEKGTDHSAVERLALFYDFQDLVPAGRRGDEMIRKLAGRLVDVDLLDQSIELLAYQVEKRLQGAARAEVAGQLAFIHLLNREPEKALAVLRRTRQAQLSNDIELQRNLVEARALAQVGRGKLAVELLNGEEASEFKRLKADLLWESKEYGDAGTAIEDALGEAWKLTEPLSALQRAEVLRAAVAHALAGDQSSIDRLRQQYGEAMSGTPDAITFNVLTGRIDGQGTEFRQIARNVAAVNTLESFLKEYREKYRPGGNQSGAPAG